MQTDVVNRAIGAYRLKRFLLYLLLDIIACLVIYAAYSFFEDGIWGLALFSGLGTTLTGFPAIILSAEFLSANDAKQIDPRNVPKVFTLKSQRLRYSQFSYGIKRFLLYLIYDFTACIVYTLVALAFIVVSLINISSSEFYSLVWTLIFGTLILVTPPILLSALLLTFYDGRQR
ncbi:MAG: hypothetical protein ACHQJ6_05845 [Candidatus Berkiellales bacterium]